VKDAVPPPSPSGDSLLDILKQSGQNTFDILAAQTQIQAEQFGFLNEQVGAGLLYQDVLVGTLDEISFSMASIASTLQVIASTLVDSVSTSPDPEKDLGSSLDGVVSAIHATSSKDELADISERMKTLESYAEVQKERAIFNSSVQPISDLEGNVVVHASPDQIKANYHANATKTHSDINNDSYDDIDLPLLDLLPIIPFHGVSSSFDKSVDISVNPFSHKNI
jgi:hypothetical protein